MGMSLVCFNATSIVLQVSMALWSLSGARVMPRLSCPSHWLCHVDRTCVATLCSVLLSGNCIMPCC